jgi:hypothetical protein
MIGGAASATGGQRLDQADIQRARDADVRDVWTRLGLPELPTGGGNLSSPWRDDSSPSLQVGGAKNIVFDHGTGEPFDAIALVQRARECGFAEAVTWINGGHSTPQAPARAARPKSKPEPTLILPVPDDAPMPPAEHPTLGRPSRRWEYMDAQGRLLNFVCRFDTRDGKEIRPLTFCRLPDGSRAWRWQALHEPRPLYGLDQLATRPAAPVLWLEGEKARDAAVLLFPDFVVIASPGGCGAVGKTDYKPLKGRHVWIWPDADAPGRKAAQDVGRLALAAGAAEVHVVNVPRDFPDKWDLGDDSPAGWDAAKLRELLDAAPVWTPATPTADAPALPIWDARGHLIPLNVAKAIMSDRRIIHVGGAFHEYEKGVYHRREAWVYEKRAVELIGATVKRGQLQDVVKLLQVETAIEQERVNGVGRIVNLANGLLDLDHGLKPHDPGFISLTQIPIEFDPQAQCPTWKKALAEHSHPIGHRKRVGLRA